MIDASSLLKVAVNTDIAPQDQMFDGGKDHYFGVGLSALYAISNSLLIRESYGATTNENLDILDFGCGCGRVTRFIKAAYPRSRVFVTDLRAADVQWCVEKLCCLLAPTELPKSAYDLVWLGSVFTHLPRSTAAELIQVLSRTLKPNGVLLFTTQGRFAFERLQKVDWNLVTVRPWMSYGLSRDGVSEVLRGYENDLYGYVDYPHQKGYGVCVAPPQWYMEEVSRTQRLTQIFLQERAYDDHQDVLGFMNRDILEPRSLEFLKAASSTLNL